MTRSQAVRALALGALAAAVYAGALHGALLLDDVSTIISNPTLHSPLHLLDVLAPPVDTTVAGRPIANLTFAIDMALFGPNVVALRATNVIIHVLAAVFLMLLVEATLLLPRFGRRHEHSASWLSFAVAAIWLAHPMQTESVTYLSQRVEALMGMFLFFVLYAAVRARTSRSWTATAIVACALGMGSKEVMATAPILVLLYDRAFQFASFRDAWRERYPFYLALVGTWIVTGLLAASNPRGLSAGLHFASVSAWDYLRIQFIAVPYYIVLAFWPTHLVFDYGEAGSPGVPIPQHIHDWLPPALLLVALAVGTVAALRRWPAIGFLGAAFFLLLAPSSSFIPIITEAMAEHRMYVPLACLIAVSVLAVFSLLEELRRRLPARLWPALLGVGVVCVVSWFGRLTVERNRDYQTSLSLWQDTAEKWPANPRALGSYALALEGAGEVDRAQHVFERVLYLQPKDFLAHYHLGRFLARRGDCDDALDHFSVALGHLDNDGLVEFRTADCLVAVGRLSEALAMYQKALMKKPGDGEFETHLALLLWQLGRSDEALAEHRLALTHWPEWGEGHALYARTLRHVGKPEEARAEMERALKLEPGSPPVHAEAGRLAAQEGRWTDARRELELSARAKPDLAVYEDLSWLLMPHDPRASADWASRAASLAQGIRRWRDLGLRALALAEAGDATSARLSAQDALRLERRRPGPGDETFKALVMAAANGERPAGNGPAIVEFSAWK